MAFRANPLSLSVPEPAFETWLRDTGYLEVLDQRTTDLRRLSSAPSASASSSADGTSAASASASATASVANGFFISIFSHVITLLSLLTLNPFAKLTSDDFGSRTPSWTSAFLGSCDSYSFPSTPLQARLRVHENVKRYARNYASLFILFFACSLYQMPVALVGLILSLALWDVFKFCADRWGLERYPVLRQSLIRAAQCVTAVILFFSNVQMAFLCALGISYAAMVLHASFRKLTTSNQSSQRDGNRRTSRK